MSYIKKIGSSLRQSINIYKRQSELKNKGKKIFLFGAPFHSNMGDQAQTFCSVKWFKKNYPEYEVFVFNTLELTVFEYKLLKIIKKYSTKEDRIFLHSGYHTTDLYMMEENMQRETVKLFPDNKIVVLPQTILFESKEEEKKSSSMYNSHKDITFLCRDDLSYETAKKIFSKCNLYKYPDIVTTLISTKEFNNERKGILLCIRNDKESFHSKESVTKLRSELEKIDFTEITDTTISLHYREIAKDREKVLNNIFNEYSKYKLIITDRYHGTIFSLISNTPVIVLSSTDHKLSSGVKWFPESFEDYVEYIEDINKVPEYAKEVFNRNYEYKLPNYFNEEFYDKLKEKIERGVK